MNISLPTDSRITFSNRLDHFLARIGYRRGERRVEPGLYRIGEPGLQSPIFATGNYTLSFDALRSALGGVDGWILVLDTKGVNVWCAAGKGTFGTEEMVRMIVGTGLKEKIETRRIIVPQLGGPGIAAHLVKKQTGFKVVYGPVMAVDLPEYLATGEVTPYMRRVRFPLMDRVALIPIEVKHVFGPVVAITGLLALLDGGVSVVASLTALIGGAVLFPILLPILPSSNYTVKGLWLGYSLACPVAGYAWLHGEAVLAIAYILAMPPVTAFLALNFTGATPYTSPSGVKREVFRYIRPLTLLFGGGILILTVKIIGGYM